MIDIVPDSNYVGNARLIKHRLNLEIIWQVVLAIKWYRMYGIGGFRKLTPGVKKTGVPFSTV